MKDSRPGIPPSSLASDKNEKANLLRKIEALQLELSSVKDQLRSTEEKYDDICNSFIWRKTKWLRDALDYARNWRSLSFFLREGLKRRTWGFRPLSGDSCYDWPGYANAWNGSVAVVQCIFEFDPLLNQRPVNLAKYLSNQGFLVIFVVWQYHEKDKVKNSFRLVANNILQIPYFNFIHNVPRLDRRHGRNDILFVTFPAATIVGSFPYLRQAGYGIVYDIMDDWEGFYRAGQAVWYEKGVEEQAVLSADLVTAVSEPLRSKFSPLRNDICVVSNGLSPELSGVANRNCARGGGANADLITVGYVGHMTDSWLDWDAVITAAEQNPRLRFELIGSGASPETMHRLAGCSSIVCHGSVPPNRLHGYVRTWQVAIIPFRNDALAHSVDPIKLYEYLYFGLPVVVTGIPGVAAYPSVHFCHAEELGRVIVEAHAAAADKGRDRGEVDSFLRERTWDHLFSTMLVKLETSSHLKQLYA